jgi:hypothetical protein
MGRKWNIAMVVLGGVILSPFILSWAILDLVIYPVKKFFDWSDGILDL